MAPSGTFDDVTKTPPSPPTSPSSPVADDEIYARTYDALNIGWHGELAAYLEWARASARDDGRPKVLELGSGSGRVAQPLADAGCEVTGVDVSATMLGVARSRADGTNPRYVLGDARTFALDERFDLAIIPAHSFQFMLTSDDQHACLRNVRRHLRKGGWLVVHVEAPAPDWPAGLPVDPPAPEARSLGAALLDAPNGVIWRRRFAWTYDPMTEVATLHSDWMCTKPDGTTELVPHPPIGIKVVGQAEMEHALQRARFAIRELRVGFERDVETGDDRERVWVAQRAGTKGS